MVTTVIITFCVLVLLAYIFDLTAEYTKIPSVLLLLLLGVILKEGSGYIEDLAVEDIERWLPVMGTIVLIMIVLEGAMELEFSPSKKEVIKRSFWTALIPIVLLSLFISAVFSLYGGYNFRYALINALPFCIISSAIAIPTVANFNKRDKEFVIYESSLSDILGVIFFNAVTLNEVFSFQTVLNFGWQIVLMLVISFVATLGLAFLISKIKHPIKFMPMIILVILIYQEAKIFHLSALMFILFFGLFMGNIDELQKLNIPKPKFLGKIDLHLLHIESHKLSEILREATFLVRAIFFIMFGYTMDYRQLVDGNSVQWAILITLAIYAIRSVQLTFFKMNLSPLIFIAPRGLITILLFYSINPANSIAIVNKPLVVQVIVITCIILMFGSLLAKKDSSKIPSPAIRKKHNSH
ncbi:MAG: cation:proton antiporter [Niabella sp.]